MPALQQRVPAVAPEPEVLLQLLLDEEPVGAPRKGGSVKTWSDYVAEAEQYRLYKQRCEQLEAALTEGWALELVERVERNHNELQQLGLTERESGEESRKLLGSMATDAVYFAALIRDARATLASGGDQREPRPTHAPDEPSDGRDLRGGILP
jgi:hypothetical protein